MRGRQQTKQCGPVGGQGTRDAGEDTSGGAHIGRGKGNATIVKATGT